MPSQNVKYSGFIMKASTVNIQTIFYMNNDKFATLTTKEINIILRMLALDILRYYSIEIQNV